MNLVQQMQTAAEQAELLLGRKMAGSDSAIVLRQCATALRSALSVFMRVTVAPIVESSGEETVPDVPPAPPVPEPKPEPVKKPAPKRTRKASK